MKPAQFEYHAPATLDAAIALLARHKGEARPLAGGQSLLPMMNFRVVTPAAIVDLNRIPGLAYIRAEGGTVRIGAMTRHRQVEFSPVIAEKLPLLAEAIRLVAHLPIRTRGTMGGSLAHADPAAELPMVLQALEGEVVARGPGGERTIKAADFLRGMLTTSLAADEILTEVRFPATPPRARCAVEEFSRRRGDFAIAAVAAVIERDGNRCVKARLATAGVGPASIRLRDAEAILERDGLGDDAVDAAAAKAAATVEPQSDQQGSAEYRRHLTRVLAARAVRRARTVQ
ncbi:MAG TPA: xanthine dehydrogenase family protein subunit M [Stellaceae bacterium]|nr:xanthine dehydrogenase family protein subunit M [Stellaceae bacterium]